MITHEPDRPKLQARSIFEKFVREITPLAFRGILDNSRQPAVTNCDFLAEVEWAGRATVFSITVKSTGQPRIVREAAGQIGRSRAHLPDAVPIIMAPFLSEAARQICREEQIGYLDFVGNAHVAFDAVLIDRQVPTRPQPERRSLRSLFKPQSARVVRRLLADPAHSWRVLDLARAASVSIGLVSNIRTELRQRCWAEQSEKGFHLTDPDALLDAWADDYDLVKSRDIRRFTGLDGDALASRLLRLPSAGGRSALAAYSAAEWWAPHVRQEATFFYADEQGFSALERVLELRPAAASANVFVRMADEPGILDDALQLGSGLWVTSPVQTYLDLLGLGRDGEAGAAHLRQMVMAWPGPDTLRSDETLDDSDADVMVQRGDPLGADAEADTAATAEPRTRRIAGSAPET